ncbi:MAG: hypothetical protein WC295_13960, partial [Methanoregula sp.]
GEANCIQSLGNIHFRESDNVAARTTFQTAIPLYKKVGDVLGEANCIKSLGLILIQKKSFENGRKKIFAAVKIYDQIHDRYSKANCLAAFADLLQEKGMSKDVSADEINRLFQEAADIFEEIRMPDAADRCRKRIRR